jgi:hypothetical protein
MSSLFGIEKKRKFVQASISNSRYSDMGFRPSRSLHRVDVSLGQNLEQRTFSNHRETDNSGFQLYGLFSNDLDYEKTTEQGRLPKHNANHEIGGLY